MTIADSDLVSPTILGLHKSWYSFQDVVTGRENIPSWEIVFKKRSEEG